MMSFDLAADTPHWYAIHTHPRQEDRAEENLRAWKVTTFSPKLKRYKYSKGVLTSTVKPLFPGYIFARFKASELLHKVSYTRGVNSVVSFDFRPAPVSDEIIELIKSRVAEGYDAGPGERLKAGDKVVVMEGPLKDLEGIFEREVKHTERVMLLLTAISYQSRVQVPREFVKKVGYAGV